MPTGTGVDAKIAGLIASLPAFDRAYRLRAYKPLWSADARRALIAVLAAAGEDGLDPERYGLAGVTALAVDPARAAHADVALSLAFVRYVHDLHTPGPGAAMAYVDAPLAPQTDEGELIEAAARAPSLTYFVRDMRRMHPLYIRLRAALAAYRETGANPSPLPGPRYEKLLLANMDRLRALPAHPGPRYVLVDAASARLFMVEDGQIRDAMEVVVGKRSLQTPSLAGFIRYAVTNPYWNLPPDLVRARAVEVVRSGPGVLARERLELLSDWSASARVLEPAEVDWGAVAAGTQKLRMRQLPGPDNMMGQVKFMLPNRLGIYLHDTPHRDAFASRQRTLSSGCVRLEDAARLGRWLFAGDALPASADTDHRIDLPTPVPVYIVYLTAIPGPQGVIMQRDVYGRDGPYAV
jgi:murein L,D-transpeptidase YcbB/YkuD